MSRKFLFAAPRRVVWALAVATACADGGATAHMPVPNSERATTFVIGRISPDPRRVLPRLDAMAEHLASRLGDIGFAHGHGIVADDVAQLAQLLRDGHVDMVSESAAAALRLADLSGAEIVLREWKDKVPVYRGVIIVAKKGPVHRLSDLRGRRIALEDRGSTTGYLLPLAALRAAGLPVVELPAADAPVPAGAVGYVFSGGELNVSSWTARGLVDAGGFSDLDFEDNDHTPKRMRADLRIIHMTPPVIRSVVLLRPGLAPSARSRILTELLAIGDDATAEKVRHEYYRLRRYDALDADGRRSLDAVRRALAAVSQPGAP